MINLFIDTSASDVSIAVLKDNQVLSEINKSIPNKHSIYVVPFIDEVLKNASLTPDRVEKIYVVTGPGSFTGVRIGVTIAKTYAYLKKIPITAVSSLKMLALSNPSETVLSLIDAKHNHYYLGLYNKEKEEIVKEHFGSKEEVLEIIDKYHPTIVSLEEINHEEIKSSKQQLDISKIISYYQDKEEENYFSIKPNYLKLPQALEERHD